MGCGKFRTSSLDALNLCNVESFTSKLFQKSNECVDEVDGVQITIQRGLAWSFAKCWMLNWINYGQTSWSKKFLTRTIKHIKNSMEKLRKKFKHIFSCFLAFPLIKIIESRMNATNHKNYQELENEKYSVISRISFGKEDEKFASFQFLLLFVCSIIFFFGFFFLQETKKIQLNYSCLQKSSHIDFLLD